MNTGIPIVKISPEWRPPAKSGIVAYLLKNGGHVGTWGRFL